MSIRKKAFNAWAPREGQVWTKFAKPAMFVHVTSPKFRPTLNEIEIPHAFQRLDDGKTAIIADLPSIEGVAAGIGLARLGFRPVPLYNGIHEVNNGGLPNAVDNRDIIAAQATALLYWKTLTLGKPRRLFSFLTATEIFLPLPLKTPLITDGISILTIFQARII